MCNIRARENVHNATIQTNLAARKRGEDEKGWFTITKSEFVSYAPRITRTSRFPFFLHVNTSSVPLAQHDGSALYSSGATCPQEHRPEFPGFKIVWSIRSCAGRGCIEELMSNSFRSSVSNFQSACRLDRMVSVDSCMLSFNNKVRSTKPAMVRKWE